MKVLLFNPPSKQLIIKDQYCSFSSKASYYWIPIDLLILSGQLDSRFSIHILDAIIDKLDHQEALDRMNKLRPDFVITLSSALTWKSDLQLLQEAKDLFAFHSCLIGDLFYYYPEKMINCAGIDSILRQYPCPGLDQFILSGQSTSSILQKKTTPSVSSSNRNERSSAEKLIPRHDLFSLNKYTVPFNHQGPSTSVVTSYGCKFKCAYCPASKVDYRERPLNDIVAELEYLKENAIDAFWMRDFTFALNKNKTMDLLQSMKKYHFKWYCLSRTETLDHHLLKEMKEAGCQLLMLGVDTLVPHSMIQQGRNQNFSSIKKMINAAYENQIEVLLHQIIGFPGETLWQMIHTSWSLSNTKANYLSLNYYSIRPGAKEFKIEELERYSSADMDSAYPDNLYSSHHPLKLRFIKITATYLFYLRPTRIARILKKAGSIYRLKQIVQTGLSQLF